MESSELELSLDDGIRFCTCGTCKGGIASSSELSVELRAKAILLGPGLISWQSIFLRSSVLCHWRQSAFSWPPFTTAWRPGRRLTRLTRLSGSSPWCCKREVSFSSTDTVGINTYTHLAQSAILSFGARAADMTTCDFSLHPEERLRAVGWNMCICTVYVYVYIDRLID